MSDKAFSLAYLVIALVLIVFILFTAHAPENLMFASLGVLLGICIDLSKSYRNL